MEDIKLDTLGNRIRFARREAGFASAGSLAEAVSVLAGRKITQQAIQKLEDNISSSSWSIIYISEITGRSAYWLVTGEESKSGMSVYGSLTPENQRRLDESALAFQALEKQTGR
jgi:hypothetical protein